MGSKQSRGSRSFLGGADYGGPVADGNIRILNSVECGGEIFSLRYTEDGTDVCVGLLDGSIKVGYLHIHHSKPRQQSSDICSNSNRYSVEHAGCQPRHKSNYQQPV